MITHTPVLLKEMLENLCPQPGETYIDATFGGGGYTNAILNAAPCKVISIDRDKNVLPFASITSQKYKERFQFHNITFSAINEILNENKVNGIIADFGVSSMQLDEPERGFSFTKTGNLDMRMGKTKYSAFEIINSFTEKDLADIIFKYGEDGKSRKIANFIIRARNSEKIQTTTQLADIIENAYGGRKYWDKIHPATKTFQAIRIFINEELEEIQSLLNNSALLLKEGGRLICVSFHSLEDRIVKNFLKDNSPKKQKINKYAQHISCVEKTDFLIKNKDVIIPSIEEIKANPRARSAKMRCATKT